MRAAESLPRTIYTQIPHFFGAASRAPGVELTGLDFHVSKDFLTISEHLNLLLIVYCFTNDRSALVIHDLHARLVFTDRRGLGSRVVGIFLDSASIRWAPSNTNSMNLNDYIVFTQHSVHLFVCREKSQLDSQNSSSYRKPELIIGLKRRGRVLALKLKHFDHIFTQFTKIQSGTTPRL